MLTDRSDLTLGERAALEGELAPLRTLEDVLRWALKRPDPFDLVGVITQDEFTHDIVFSYKAPRYLVFDTT